MRSVPACMCQNKSSNNCDHWKKNVLQKGPDTEKKKFGLGWDWTPQLRWLTTVCRSGFGRNVQQLFTVFSLHQCLQRAVMNESSYQLAINIFEFPDDVHSISLKSHFDACLECQVTVLSKLNFKKHASKKFWFWKKICSPAGFELATSWMQVSCSIHVYSHTAVVFDGLLLEFSPLLRLQHAIWSQHSLAMTNLK